MAADALAVNVLYTKLVYFNSPVCGWLQERFECAGNQIVAGGHVGSPLRHTQTCGPYTQGKHENVGIAFGMTYAHGNGECPAVGEPKYGALFTIGN